MFYTSPQKTLMNSSTMLIMLLLSIMIMFYK